MSTRISYTDADGETQYSLRMINESGSDWTFYVYQKLPGQVKDVFSLAWFASPYVITDGTEITFDWGISYNFVWSDTGLLQAGVHFSANGTKPCSPSGDNTTIFSLAPGPNFSKPTPGLPQGSLVINDSFDVPNDKFSVGIGMSGAGTYAVQAGTNLKHTLTPTPSYWVGAGNNLQVGTVLNIQTVTVTSEVKYDSPILKRVATLNTKNTWEIKAP